MGMGGVFVPSNFPCSLKRTRPKKRKNGASDFRALGAGERECANSEQGLELCLGFRVEIGDAWRVREI